MVGAIDTLKIYERLKVAKLEDLAAKEIAEVFNDVIEKHFVTNTSLKETELRLVKEIKEVESRLIKWSFVFWITQFAAILGIGFIILKTLNVLQEFPF